jgi:hypothetical protein
VKQAERQEELFENVIRLRRAERASPNNRELGAVRLSLENMLGETVTVSFAAQILGVSHTALSRWIDRGDIAAVIDVDGRKAVPVSLLAGLFEAVERERAAGRTHVLESVVREGLKRAELLPVGSLRADGEAGEDAGRASELRGLAYHRAIARRLDRRTANLALALVRSWRDAGSIDSRYADSWEHILEGPLPGIRKTLEGDDPRSRDLRQNSPFAGLLSEAERQRIVAEIR